MIIAKTNRLFRFCCGLNEPTSDTAAFSTGGTSGAEQPPEMRVVSNVPAAPGLALHLPLPCVGCSWQSATTADGSRFCASIGKSELWKDFMEAHHSALLGGAAFRDRVHEDKATTVHV